MAARSTPPTSAEKGDALHHAVLAIEQHILHTAPHLKDKNFTIQDKKIINASGVHHEIDIFVSVESAPGYSAIYVFECKNWKDAVGKTEIIDFIEKIQCATDTHGYFVAKSFTKDAYAQAEKSSRLTLLVATENDPTGLPIPGEFHTVASEPRHFEVNLFARGRKPDSELVAVDLGTAKAEINGAPINLKEFVMACANQTVSQDVLSFRSHTLPVGAYEREGVGKRVFEPGGLVVQRKRHGADGDSRQVHDHNLSASRCVEFRCRYKRSGLDVCSGCAPGRRGNGKSHRDESSSVETVTACA